MASSSHTGSFYIFHRNEDGKPDFAYSHESPEFTHILVATNIALQALQTEISQLALVTIADRMRQKLQDPWWAHLSSEDVVKMFTDIILANFVLLYIDFSMNEPDVTGCHNRRRIFEDFDPHNQAIVLNGPRVADMCTAAKKAEESKDPNSKQSRRYRGSVFTLAITIMHELAHVFLTFLTDGASNTPPDCNAGYIAKGEGEVGEYLELNVFGGVVIQGYDPDDDPGQAGLPHLETAKGTCPISQRIIDETVRCVLIFPFRISDPPISEPLRPWPSKPETAKPTDPLDWAEAGRLLGSSKSTTNPELFEATNLELAKKNARKLHIGAKSRLALVAFQPGLRVEVVSI